MIATLSTIATKELQPTAMAAVLLNDECNELLRMDATSNIR
jgi:hypothetical protein